MIEGISVWVWKELEEYILGIGVLSGMGRKFTIFTIERVEASNLRKR